tara:strand:- start:15 stop:176 length:162 start_codon:yes stop_codon:yes gene_type:complete
MKLTKLQLKQIIKEEIEKVMREVEQESSGFDYDEEAAEAELQAKMAEPMTKAK